jgi:Fe-Mn family superoxide dismutase
MSFAPEPLPYAKNALAPHLSEETLNFHYDKHHTGYATKLNALVKDNAEVAKMSLEEVIKTQKGAIFNCAAQIWNHNFYWRSMKTAGGGEPTGKIAAKIDSDLGGFAKFKEDFSAACAGHFGSGWAWLVQKPDGKLAITQTHDAVCPIVDGDKPVLTCDVWEHAYYIDFRNDRPAYIAAWWNLVNWEHANSMLS